MLKISFYQVENEIDCLVEDIKHHDQLYFYYNTLEISDIKYDALRNRLIDLESVFPVFIRQDTPTKNVGVTPSDYPFRKYYHKLPMFSLENIFFKNDLSIFIDKCNKSSTSDMEKVDFFVEPKFDGLSISLIYEYGCFVKAVTRGALDI